MFLLTFYVPKKQCEQVKTALFQAGAGTYQNYKECCWQTVGKGQFCPLSGSQPFIGKKGKKKILKEIKVEMICEEKRIKEATTALLASHPYEEPAYSVIRLENFT